MPEQLSGIGVSAGRTAGPLARMGQRPELPAPVPVADTGQEQAVARHALETVAADLTARSQRSTDPTATAILEAEAMMAADPVLHDDVADAVAAGADAAHAIDAVLTEHRRAMEAIGGNFAERATDIDDIRQRAVASALGLPVPGLPEPGHRYILAADDLAPADTSSIDPAVVLGLVTERGGPTSHTAILARALGIPAIVACPGALAVADGTLVLLDGTAGTVQLGVTSDTADQVRRDAARQQAQLAASSGPGQTSDGHPVKLMVNIGSAADLQSAAAGGAQGVGLFRTELAFLSRKEAPSEAEQRELYTAVFEAARGRTVVVRTLDAGADKPLPFLGLHDEPNPALGVRGLRTSRQQPGVLDGQLAAIAAAASATGAKVWVMAPMVSTAAEAEEFAARARSHGLVMVGAMIEVPAAALRARHLLDSLDFLSIGTNDLSQYTLATDRMCGELSDLLDPWQPALLQLIAECGAAAARAGKPVGVCGEAAADPALAPVLAGLGITSLSMSARSLAPVRAELARHTIADCQHLAALALEARDAATARAIMHRTTAPTP
jgi:phosphoenolpyruvate-protein phosphotransferase